MYAGSVVGQQRIGSGMTTFWRVRYTGSGALTRPFSITASRSALRAIALSCVTTTSVMLASRELGREMGSPVRHAELLERRERERVPLAGRHLRGDERRLDVLLRGEGRDQIERLEDESEGRCPQPCHLRLRQLREIAPLEVDATRGRTVEAAEREQEGRLPLPGRPLDGQELAVLDGQIHVVERAHLGGAAAEDLVDVAQLVHLAPFGHG
jgi:hypothetical protein